MVSVDVKHHVHLRLLGSARSWENTVRGTTSAVPTSAARTRAVEASLATTSLSWQLTRPPPLLMTRLQSPLMLSETADEDGTLLKVFVP